MTDRWNEVERIVHAALSRAAEERASFVAEACAGDGTLLADVESLLAQERAADALLSTPAAALLSIGATFEGTFRNHMVMPDGPLRHSNYYAVVIEDWPRVKAMLEARIAALVEGPAASSASAALP